MDAHFFCMALIKFLGSIFNRHVFFKEFYKTGKRASIFTLWNASVFLFLDKWYFKFDRNNAIYNFIIRRAIYYTGIFFIFYFLGIKLLWEFFYLACTILAIQSALELWSNIWYQPSDHMSGYVSHFLMQKMYNFGYIYIESVSL